MRNKRRLERWSNRLQTRPGRLHKQNCRAGGSMTLYHYTNTVQSWTAYWDLWVCLVFFPSKTPKFSSWRPSDDALSQVLNNLQFPRPTILHHIHIYTHEEGQRRKSLIILDFRRHKKNLIIIQHRKTKKKHISNWRCLGTWQDALTSRERESVEKERPFTAVIMSAILGTCYYKWIKSTRCRSLINYRWYF